MKSLITRIHPFRQIVQFKMAFKSANQIRLTTNRKESFRHPKIAMSNKFTEYSKTAKIDILRPMDIGISDLILP